MNKVRYAVVGAGWISQEAFMPGVHGADNSEMVAIVTGDMDKGRALAEFHGVPHVFGYAQYDEMLKMGLVDAVYIALPNSLHADYAIRAARAGVHVLVEKPLATTIADSEAMIEAAAQNHVWMMTAYRLHTEPGTLDILDMIRRGDIGDPRIFSANFAFQADAANHRLKAAHWGGALQDIGVYCVNAMRHVFSAEPYEVVAVTGSNPGDARFDETPATVAATLRFPEGKIASFIVSFGADSVDTYTVIGTEGRIEVEQGFSFETPRRVRLIRKGVVEEKLYPFVDEFAGQASYFSDCILKGERPEPDGEEGLADMTVMMAIEESARSGRAQPITLPARTRHPKGAMARAIPRSDRRLLV